MTNHPLPAATLQTIDTLTFGLDRLSRDIRAALLTHAGGVVLATATVLGLAALPLPVHAGGWQVTKLADTADGTCDADCSLREAIAVANASTGADFIVFASNVTGTITLDIATHGNLDITDELTITGPGPNQLAISGGDVAPGTEDGGIFNATSATSLTTITGLTLTNGNSTQNGGAISAFDGLALDDVTIKASHAGDDGGGFFLVGNATLSNSAVSGNVAGRGGGFFVDGNATLTNSAVSDNTGSGGGGFFVLSGNADITNSTVSGNAAGYGGGFRVVGGDVTLTNSTVSGNDAGGTVVLSVVGNASLTYSTVSGNTADVTGGFFSGGFYVNGNASLTNSTVSGNQADVGGGFFVHGNATLNNSIVASNTAPSNPDVFVSPAYTLFAGHSLIGLYDGTYTDNGGNMVGSTSAAIDPLLGPLVDNGGPTWTHALGANSPGLDAGSNTLAAGLDYDQRGPGHPRIVAGTVDMGAFERSDLIFRDGFD